jgi:hypothetical protein
MWTAGFPQFLAARDTFNVTVASESDQNTTANGAMIQGLVDIGLGHRSRSHEPSSGKIRLSDETEIKDEAELTARALDDLISKHLAAGGNRFVLAAACVWGGVKAMSEITSSQSAANALRAIANQIDPPVDMSGVRGAVHADDALMAAVREHRWERVAAKPKPSDDAQSNPVNQDIVRDVVGEAVDLIDQTQPELARALLMALRARLVASPRPQTPGPRRRWGG